MTTGERQVRPFDVCAELPTGTTVLEASAGTGKTYTIAALAARYVAEGHAELGQLLLVTFGRMATNELRTRVRDRLVCVERVLAAVLSAEPLPPDVDDLERLLASGTTDEVADRRARVVRALSDFDAATIATTHEFCSRMLDELGILGDREPDVVFAEALSELTREAASDVYLRRYATRDLAPPMDYPAALRLAAEAVEAGQCRLVPTFSASSSGESSANPVAAPGADRVAYAEELRREVGRRKQRGRLFTYDDMLTSLRDVLADPLAGPAAARRLRERYRIVLVDEFQDTDPVQWDILRRAFHGHATLIVIGDPKQAIYAFRGADVFSYLHAVDEADSVATLATNWRSDRALTDALQVLMGGAALGDPRIVVRPVESRHTERRLNVPAGSAADAGAAAPVRIRIIPHEPDAERLPSVGQLRPRIVADLVSDITALLASGLRVSTGEAATSGDAQDRRVSPADVAVLVRKNERGEAIRDALVQAGVPAVLLGATSVYASPVASEWLTLLVALEQPRQPLVRRAALTCFLGWSFGRLAAADEEALADLTQRVRWWGRMLRTRGVAALLEVVTADTGLAERMLAQVGGERALTDLRHIGQSLHAVMVSRQLGVSALLAWLREQVNEARAARTEGLRRLETDADAVQILTVHRSKGLEFPIVYLPEAWDRYVSGKDEGRTLRLHDESSAGADAWPAVGVGHVLDVGPVLDVGGVAAAGRVDRFAQYQREEAGEELRLLYVALTRAKSQVVTWWAPSAHNTSASALQRLLYGPRREGAQPEPAYPLSGDPFSCGHLGSGFSLERVEERALSVWRTTPLLTPTLRARAFDRQLDLDWRRTSYSALTAAVHGLDLSDPGVGSEAEPAKEDDESVAGQVESAGRGESAAAESSDPGLARPSPMCDLPSGTQFGTVVHAVLEGIDPGAPDLLAELRRVCAEQLARGPAMTMTAGALAQGLLPPMETPLGALASNLRLCDIARADRLTELDFELPLAGGDVAKADVRLGQLVPLLRRHLPPEDPLTGYADLVGHPLLAEQPLRGYLTGSIDAVLRVRQPDGQPRYLVVDYKTNWLGDFDGGQLSLGHYAPPVLAEAMMHSHYPLQALLYSIALHRFLRWRQPDYDPDEHLGGVLYLFLRGMAGADTPVVDGNPSGVFSWRPPTALVTELSDLVDRGAE